MVLLSYEGVNTALDHSDMSTIALHMFSLMMRNVTSDGLVFADPATPEAFSEPGCIIAAPSFPAGLKPVNQDYVFNWTRIAAITAIEIAAKLKLRERDAVQALIDYVNFAKTCQDSGTQAIGHACYTMEGRPRDRWSEQSDGPALQTLAVLRAFPQLNAAAQETAVSVIVRNMDYLMRVYQGSTKNLWEERDGFSFFARSVQLRCFQEVIRNTYGIPVPESAAFAVTWLEKALRDHWNGTYYVTLLSPSDTGGPPPVTLHPSESYDPNIDIVMASVYGEIPYTDTKLLATAAQLRQQWADSFSPVFYPINAADLSRGIGPAIGRYPGDSYDGNIREPYPGGHPWPVCTANFAELHYGLANTIAQTNVVPFDNLSKNFFSPIEIDEHTPWREAVVRLRDAGDRMLYAIIVHSDHFELGQQIDGTNGYGKSVRNYTWSYAAFLSAVRAKNGHDATGLPSVNSLEAIISTPQDRGST